MASKVLQFLLNIGWLNAKPEINLAENTLPRKNMNLPYSIRMYWTSFWQPAVNVQQNIFEKTHVEIGRSHLYASFGTFYVQIGQLFAAQWVILNIRLFKNNPKNSEIDIFLRWEWFVVFQTYFKDSLCLE